MDIYYPDIWYDTSKLSLLEKNKLLTIAKEFSFGNYWVDLLDCNKSWKRQKIEIPFKEILKMLDNKSHFVVVHRRGYESWKDINSYFLGHTWKLEIGFSTYNSPTYFLWIYIDEKYIDLLVNNFNLKVITYNDK